ncbi:hypothetical protein D3C71_1082890 [compost metagenome]
MPRRLARSVSFVRRTGMPVRSAWICSSAELPERPPPTTSSLTRPPNTSSFAWMHEATECAMPSRIARATSARVVAIEMPVSDARAAGSMAGTRRPVSAGMKVTSREEPAVAASALICAALSNHCSFSQTQFRAEPVVATKVSTAKCETPCARRAVIVRVPSCRPALTGCTGPVITSTKLPVPCTHMACSRSRQPRPMAPACWSPAQARIGTSMPSSSARVLPNRSASSRNSGSSSRGKPRASIQSRW